jgi:hypothetical protein
VNEYQVMDTDGINVGPVQARSSDEAVRIVSGLGYRVPDVMDNTVVIAPGA